MTRFTQEQPEQEHKKDTEESPLVVVRKTINANVEKVFQAWGDEKLVLEWWGPKGFTCPNAKLDFKVGGKYLFAMQSDNDKKKLWSTGTYLEIHSNQKIVCSDFPSNPEGEIVSPEEAGFEGPFPDEGEAYITVEFQSEGEQKTRLTLSHENLPARMHDECVDGWSSSLDKLKELVEVH